MKSRRHPSHSPRIASPARAPKHAAPATASAPAPASDSAATPKPSAHSAPSAKAAAHAHNAPQDTSGLRASIAQGWRNVWLLFLGDMRHTMKNVIAAIVTMGLVLIPATYAWFTTLGFWDPYANTGELKVAIANDDAGYQSDLLPMRVNAGEQVVSALRANDQFHWEFVDRDEALEGVRSGAYYAAMVIPEDFSADLMTVFSADIKHPEIDYYSNDKENAIAPRVTSTGASTLQEEIDQAFTRTVADIALNSTSNLTDFMNGDGIANYGSALLNRLSGTVDEMSTASTQVTLIAQLVGSTGSLLTATSDILQKAGTAGDALEPLFDSSQQGLAEGEAALAGMGGLIDSAVAQAGAAYDSVSAAVDAAFKTMKDYPASAAASLTTMKQGADDAKAAVDAIIAGLPADTPTDTVSTLRQISTELGNLSVALGQAASSATSSGAQAEQAYEQVKSAIASARASLDGMTSAFDSQLNDATAAFGSQLSAVKDAATTIAEGLDQVSAGLADTSGNLAGSLSQVQAGLNDTAAVLASAADELAQARDQLKEALDTHDLETVRRIIGDDPAAVASFIAAPTKLERHAVYAMANNGSAMSPFYTSLGLWIGAIFCVALMNVTPTRRSLAALHDPKPWQIYLGRWGVFAVVSLLQATVLCGGNLLFLGIQCEHPLLYLLTGWIAALVFSNTVYTLTVSFGNVGKAVAIVLLVMQLGGSGGLFPIQMSAPMFQAIYPWLPFAHSMEAFQSCMAGIYGNQLLMSLLLLLTFLVPSLLLGLALRNPVIRIVDFINKKLEETKVV